MKTFREGQTVKLLKPHPWAGKVGLYDGLDHYNDGTTNKPCHAVRFESGMPSDRCFADDHEIDAANRRSK